MLIPLGFLAASGVSAGSFDLLETQTLTGSQNSITFSSLGTYASTYEHLQIRFTARSDRSGAANSNLSYKVNGVGTNSYAVHFLAGNGSSVFSAQATSYFGYVTEYLPGPAQASGIFNAGVIDLLDAFSTNKNKVMRAFVGSSTSAIQLVSGLLVNTDALTSFTLLDNLGNNLVSGTRVSLYGIKAA